MKKSAPKRLRPNWMKYNTTCYHVLIELYFFESSCDTIIHIFIFLGINSFLSPSHTHYIECVVVLLCSVCVFNYLIHFRDFGFGSINICSLMAVNPIEFLFGFFAKRTFVYSLVHPPVCLSRFIISIIFLFLSFFICGGLWVNVCVFVWSEQKKKIPKKKSIQQYGIWQFCVFLSL